MPQPRVEGAGILAPLRVVPYRRLLGCMFASNVALFAHDVAAAWLMLQMTGSAFMVGLITVGVVAPQLLVGLPAGVLADRFSRTGLLTLTLAVRAAVAGLLAVVDIAGGMAPVVLVATSVLLGTGLALSLPAFSAMIPDVVPHHIVGDAVSLQSAVMNLARALGPALGGLLAGLGRFEVAFALNGVGYLLVVLSLRGIELPPLDHVRRERFSGALRTGLRYVRRSAVLRNVVAGTALFAVVAASLQVLLPTLAEARYGLSGTGYGLLSACFGGGALAGAATMGPARRRLRHHAAPVAMLLAGLSGLALGLTRSPAVAAVALATSGVASIWAWTVLTTIGQLHPEPALRARALSVMQTARTGLLTLGATASGMLADRMGPGFAMTAFASVAIVASGVLLLLRLPDTASLAGPSTAPVDAPTVHRADARRGTRGRSGTAPARSPDPR